MISGNQKNTYNWGYERKEGVMSSLQLIIIGFCVLIIIVMLILRKNKE